MEYIFLVVVVFWSAQFVLAYWQLRRFHKRIGELRKLGRTSIGMHGNRWRGRTYAVLVTDKANIIRHAETFDGWTVFSKLKPFTGLNGTRLEALLADSAATPEGLRQSQWLAFQHAAQFLNNAPAPTNAALSQG
ncbi:MAG: transcriptional regulator GutM [Chloroflexaceae bacterium]|jgi:DNA-binding transcriptional regulator of glucitol operon|nr:transcriptional regulator GutM [Chloroflexaceae bacterium]